MAVVEQELNAFHVVLKFAVAQILNARSCERQIQFFDCILKYFEVPLILRLVAREGLGAGHMGGHP